MQRLPHPHSVDKIHGDLCNETISGWLHLTYGQLFHVEHPVEAQPSVNNHGCLP